MNWVMFALAVCSGEGEENGSGWTILSIRYGDEQVSLRLLGAGNHRRLLSPC
jgi:hypothetical protein